MRPRFEGLRHVNGESAPEARPPQSGPLPSAVREEVGIRHVGRHNVFAPETDDTLRPRLLRIDDLLEEGVGRELLDHAVPGLKLRLEDAKLNSGSFRAGPRRQGGATKYSPVLDQAERTGK